MTDRDAANVHSPTARPRITIFTRHRRRAKMRAVIQRVSEARVKVDRAVVGEIGAGLVVLVAVGRDDAPGTPAAMADKIIHLRIFNDDQGKMNRSLANTGGAILAVSQFTLYGDARGQRRPSFMGAASPDAGKRRLRRIRRRVAQARHHSRHRNFSGAHGCRIGERRSRDDSARLR